MEALRKIFVFLFLVLIKKGNRVGDAIATIDELEKGKKWKFRAVLNEENIAACKIKDAYITVE